MTNANLTVCETCIEAVYENGGDGLDYGTAVQCAVLVGEDMPDHICKRVDDPLVPCNCGCRRAIAEHWCTPVCPFFNPSGFHLDHPDQVEPIVDKDISGVSDEEVAYWEDMAKDTNANSQRRMERRGMTE